VFGHAPVTLVRSVRRATLVATAAVAAVGVLAGSVRLLPWILDPAVPWQVAAPFARGLAVVTLEAALLLGWPVGCALACFRFVEDGEARVLQSLGESPRVTLGRLAPQAMALAILLGGAAFASGGDANAPGRVATELISRARSACLGVRRPESYAIPFTTMAWLCAPGAVPRLVGSPPGSMSSVVVTALDAQIAGDFRELRLEDARLLLPGQTALTVHVDELTMRGMAPWSHGSGLPAPLRAVLLALTAWVSAWLAACAVLQRAVRGRLGALALGAVGPVSSLGVLRLLERAAAGPAAFCLVPVSAVASGALLVAVLLAYRLRRRKRAAST
jgi:hypothetical protein